ncbi:MAG: hypothetical protein AMXMBFR64_19650 [Myxococcales bacterium]
MPHGVSLAALLEDGPLPPSSALPLLGRIADALAAMHGAGLSQLCILPERVVIGAGGQVTLVGAGLVDALRTLSPGIRFPGAQWEHLHPVPALTSPELLQGESGERVDVFALAALAFLCLTGGLPFVGGALAVWRASQRGEAREASDVCPAVSRALSTALRQGLGAHPSQRPESPHALLDLLRIAAGSPRDAAVHLGRHHPTWWDARLPTVSVDPGDDPSGSLRTAQAVLEQLHTAVRERKGEPHRWRGLVLLVAALLLLLLLLPLLPP